MGRRSKKIYKAAVIMDGAIYEMETIEHLGRYWLVPGWLVRQGDLWMQPERIIALATIDHSANPDGPEPQFAVYNPLPKSLERGVVPAGQEGEYEIVEKPEIFFPVPTDENS